MWDAAPGGDESEGTVLEGAVSEDAVSEDAVSEDAVSEDAVSEDAVPEVGQYPLAQGRGATIAPHWVSIFWSRYSGMLSDKPSRHAGASGRL